MKRLKKIFSTLFVSLLAAAFVVPFAACGEPEPTSYSNTFYVSSIAGMKLKNVNIKLYHNNNFVVELQTDDEGKAGWNLSEGGQYTATVSGLPTGYFALNSTYTINSADKEITLRVSSEIIDERAPSTKRYTMGDVMYNFTIPRTYYCEYEKSGSADEEATVNVVERSVTLKDLFKDKKAVMLDFFYTTCSWCNRQEPYLVEAFEEYKDNLAIIGIDNNNFGGANDNDAVLSAFQQTSRIPYGLGMDTEGVTAQFGVQGFPHCVMIDRYGVVCEAKSTTLDADEWRAFFEKYTSDDYEQNIEQGGDLDPSFVPDMPADFDVHMPSSQSINDRINKTGTNIVFSTDNSETAWPWDFADDGVSIAPTNSGHRETNGIIYADLMFEEGQVLAFEYKLSSKAEEDLFFVAVDGRQGYGKQIMRVSGTSNSNWQTGYAYVALEKGRHEIAFMYSRTSVKGAGDDTVLIKNLHFETISDVAASGQSVNMPYFAATGYNSLMGVYTTYADVYKDGDGYYRVGNANKPSQTDPLLLVDMHNFTPYFVGLSPSSSLYNNFISVNKCTFGGVNYTQLLNTFNIAATNSELQSLVPVNDDLKTALDALCRSELGSYYSANNWLEFCVYYKHFGGDEILGVTNPIMGLTYFTAYEAKETTGKTDAEVSALNTVVFDRIFMPRGLMYKFTATKDGVFNFRSVGTQVTDAWLFDGSLNAHYTFAKNIARSDADRFCRNIEDETNFSIYYYLKEGETYYLQVAFRQVEDLGQFNFRIDWLGESYTYMNIGADGYLIRDPDTGVTTVPINVDVGFDGTNYYDKKTNLPIYLDMTEISLLFDYFTIEEILAENISTAQLSFDLSTYYALDADGNRITIPLVMNVGGTQVYGNTVKDSNTQTYSTPDAITGTVDGKDISFSVSNEKLTVAYNGGTKEVAVDSTKFDLTKGGQIVNVTVGGEELTLLIQVIGNTLVVYVNGENFIGEDYTAVMKNYLKEATECASVTSTVEGEQLTVSLNRKYINVSYGGKERVVPIDGQKISSVAGQDITFTVGTGDDAKTVKLNVRLDGNTVTVKVNDGANALVATYTDDYGDLYGMHVVDRQLYEILEMYNYSFWGRDGNGEWLKACWYFVTVDASTVA